MMKKEILNSEKGINLADEIIQVMRDQGVETSIDDYPLLKETMEYNEFSDELIEKMCDEQYITDSISSIPSPRKSESLSQFREKLNFKVRKERQRKMTIRYSALIALAAAVAVVSFLIFDVSQEEPHNTLLSNRSEINLEITVPTLISGDGERIPLKVNELAVSDTPTNKSPNTMVTEESKRNTIVVPSKYKFTVTLSDGSVVSLNANSELTYPNEFHGDSRNVKIKGEAFFIVSKSDKPFIVETDRGDVKVYGTRFNVNLNRENIMQVVLVEGSVGVTLNERDSSIEYMMSPRQLLEYNRTTQSREVQSNVNVDNYISWIDGSFRYNHIRLSHLLQELSAWYGVKFELSTAVDSNISLNVNRDMELDTLLGILENMCNVRFIKEKGGLYRVN